MALNHQKQYDSITWQYVISADSLFEQFRLKIAIKIDLRGKKNNQKSVNFKQLFASK